MAFTQDDLDKLERAISDGRGARSMSFSDHSVTFNSINDMLKLRGVMQREIDGSTSTYRLAVTSKGT